MGFVKVSRPFAILRKYLGALHVQCPVVKSMQHSTSSEICLVKQPLPALWESNNRIVIILEYITRE